MKLVIASYRAAINGRARVGRSTSRESIKILVHAGVLEVRQGQGTRIVSLNTTQDSFEKDCKQLI